MKEGELPKSSMTTADLLGAMRHVLGCAACAMASATFMRADSMQKHVEEQAAGSRPIALWRNQSVRKRFAASQKAAALLDAVMDSCSQQLPLWKDVVVIGAGLTGITVSSYFVAAGVDVAMLEKSREAGGVWRSYGNAFSRVNSTEPGYRVRLKQRPTPNTNHSHRHEILNDCLLAFEQFSLDALTFPSTELTAVVRSSDTSWRLGCLARGKRTSMSCSWAVVCTNRRLGAPRIFPVAGEESFAGSIRRGIGDDALDLAWIGQRILILGHGPYATENARTALEHGVASVTFAVRRHGIICPELIDYVRCGTP